MTDPDHTYTTVEDLYTLTYRIDPDGVARWTGEVVPLPSLVTKAPGPVIADLVRILSDPSLDEPPGVFTAGAPPHPETNQ